MHTRNTGKQKPPPEWRLDDDQTSRCGAHDVLTLSERPCLGHGESSFKYPKHYLDVQLVCDLHPMVDNGGGLVQAHEV